VNTLQPFLTNGLAELLNRRDRAYYLAKATKPSQPQFKKWLASFGKKKQQCCSAMKFQRCMSIFILIIGFEFF